jgi:3-deoxy-D-manno-octulosonic acid kinase
MGPALETRGPVPGLEGLWTRHLAGGTALEGAPEALGGAFGRGGVYRLGEVVVRPYRRGGLLGRLVQRRYLRPARFRAEWELHRRLWEDGFPTVEPLGYAWRSRLAGVEGAFFTRLVPSAAPWPRVWERCPEVGPRLLELLDALCARHVWAPDLNATNVLVLPEGDILLLDWDRARLDGSPDLLGRYRQRLHRSLLRLQAPPQVLHALRVAP